MLSTSPIFTILPAGDRDRARAFYSEKLGLEPSQVQPNGDHARDLQRLAVSLVVQLIRVTVRASFAPVARSKRRFNGSLAALTR
jgi:hypothetical protein